MLAFPEVCCGRVGLQLGDRSQQQLLQSVCTKRSSTLRTPEIRICVRRWRAVLKVRSWCGYESTQITMWVCVGTDYEMVLKLEPGNFEAQNEVKKIRQVNVKQSFKEFRVIFHISSFSFINFFFCLVLDSGRSGLRGLEPSHTAAGDSHIRPRAAETDGGAAEATGGSYSKRQSKFDSSLTLKLQWSSAYICCISVLM